MSGDSSSLRKQRTELINERRQLIDDAKTLDGAVQSAIQERPERQSGNIDEMEERIYKLEEELETGSHDSEKERNLKRQLQSLRRSYEAVMKYQASVREIDILQKMRKEKQTRIDELNKQLDELTNEMESGATIAYLQSLGAKNISRKDLHEEEVKVGKDHMGRLVGKNGANIHKLEKEFIVRINSRNESLVVMGESSNVKRCVSELSDMVNETESSVQLPKMQVYALMAHDAAYRRSIETSCRVFLSVKDGEIVVIRGGKNAVHRAERALETLFKKQTTFPVSPFLRSLLMNKKMEALHALQKECPAYLSIGSPFDSIIIVGSVEDQRTSLTLLNKFAESHSEKEEKVSYNSLFHRYLMNDKADRLRKVQNQSNTRIQYSDNTLTIRGEEAAVKAAKQQLDTMYEQFSKQVVELDVNSAQIDCFLEEKAAVMKELEQKFGCSMEVDHAKSKMRVIMDDAHRDEAMKAIQEKLDSVSTEHVSIPERLVPMFVGAKGSNVKTLRKAHDAKLDIGKGEVVISGKAESVEAMKKAVEEWLTQHTMGEIEVDGRIARDALVGEKGAKMKALVKELEVDIQIEDAKVIVMGSPAQVENALPKVKEILEVYQKEHAAVPLRAEVIRNVRDLHRPALEEKAKSLGVSLTLTRSSMLIQGEKEAVKAAVEAIQSLVAKYDDYAEEKVEVPPEEIGALLGKSGENLRKLEGELGIAVRVEEKNVWIWGPKDSLASAKEGLLANLEVRVFVSEVIPCTVKQVDFLRADRFELLHHLQDQYNVTISVPSKMPAVGPTEISVRGNRKQLQAAVPMVREALQGLIRWEVNLGEVMQSLLTESSIQLQRLALESHCRIQPEENSGVLKVVGPKEGVELVQSRIWAQLAVLRPTQYQKADGKEAVMLGLAEKKEEIAKFAKEHQATMLLTPSSILVEAAEGMDEVMNAVKQWMEEAEKENCLIEVGRNRVAFVIGAQGSRIQSIAKQSGASLSVIRDEVVHVRGKPEQVEKAKELVEKQLETYDATHISFQVDESLVFAIRGARGNNLNRIEREYRVRVRLEQDGMVSISGNDPKQVEEARNAVEQLTEEAENRPVREHVRREERERKEEEKKKEEPAAGIWEKLKQAPMLPSKTVGGSDMYKSESGYSVEL